MAQCSAVATGFFLNLLIVIVLLVGLFPFSRAGDTFGTGTREITTNEWDRESTTDHCASNEIVTDLRG